MPISKRAIWLVQNSADLPLPWRKKKRKGHSLLPPSHSFPPPKLDQMAGKNKLHPYFLHICLFIKLFFCESLLLLLSLSQEQKLLSEISENKMITWRVFWMVGDFFILVLFWQIKLEAIKNPGAFLLPKFSIQEWNWKAFYFPALFFIKLAVYGSNSLFAFIQRFKGIPSFIKNSEISSCQNGLEATASHRYIDHIPEDMGSIPS